MATLASDITGHSGRRTHTVDLDADLGVPRIVTFGGIMLVIAVVAFLMGVARPATTNDPPVIERQAVHSAITIPALRGLPGSQPKTAIPPWNVGAITFTVDPADNLPRNPILTRDNQN